MPERSRARSLRRTGLALAACAFAAAGCARKGLPSGGPPDLEPPRVLQTVPDSGAAGVPTHVRLAVTFSEGMEPRSSDDAVELAPPIPIRQRRWSGRTLTLVLADSLKADHTYTLFVGGGARDLHGNGLAAPRTVVFTTAAHFPAGVIEGRVEAVGFDAPGTLLWCYRDGRTPDSTARDFDALGVADNDARFKISGLAEPAKWRVYAFADLNRNRSFEPDFDLLVASDTLLSLTDTLPSAKDLRLRMVNKRAPGQFSGSVLDSVSDGTGAARLIVVSEADTTRRLLFDVDNSGGFDLHWNPGVYHVRAFRDLDRNKAWKRDTEPASEEITVKIEPAGSIQGVVFVLRRPAAGGASP